MARTNEAPRLMKDGLAAPAVKRLAVALADAWAPFNAKGFEEAALSGLDGLELKDRVRHLIEVMNDFLPDGYPAALKTVVRAGRNFPADQTGDTLAGFAAWPLVDWVPAYGLDHFDSSLKALRNLTGLFSAEFAVRPFLIADTGRALDHLESWLDDSSEHVRRLVSEGTRPRLPWGCRLPMFVEAPAPILPLLARLRDDPSEYVRRSVANNLNDIAKDHPAEVVRVCRAWKKGASSERLGVIRHGLRTLVKQGDKGALKVLGYTTEPEVKASLGLSAKSLQIGDSLVLEVKLTSRSHRSQKLVVDYVVHHVRSGGKSTPKVFKMRTLDLAPGASVSLEKKHSFAPRSVRRYYPGRHVIELKVAGRILARSSFAMTE